MYPLQDYLDRNNPIEGVSRHGNNYQFISRDGTQSNFKDNSLQPELLKKVKRIPEGSVVRKVETMYFKNNGLLIGFKFFGEDGKELLSEGLIEEADSLTYVERQNACYITIILQSHERIIGVKSSS